MPIFFHRLCRILLYHIFRFDKWHTSLLQDKKYALDIIQYLNQNKKRECVIEIGCGLGDIIRNLHYERRIGYDTESNVLSAAKFLSKLSCNKNITFSLFQFPETPLELFADVIIMVNWIHNVPPQTLKNNIEKYFYNNLKQNGTIIIDTVQDREYQYNHSIKSLAENLPCTVVKIGEYIRQRETFSIIKN